MPKYQVVERSFIDNHIREVGETVEFAGLPSSNLRPTDAEGEAMAEQAKVVTKAALNSMIDGYKPAGTLDATAVATIAAETAAAVMSASKGKPKAAAATEGF